MLSGIFLLFGMELASRMEKIVALVTLYYPGERCVENIGLIASQAWLVVLADNTPGTDNSDMFSEMQNVRYVANGRNLGLSVAFNRCLSMNECRGSDFLVFFDQDSRIEDKQLETLVRDFRMLERTHKVGCLGPVFFEENSGKVCGTWDGSSNAEGGCLSVPATITSSLMMRYETLKDAGFWNEHLFLDYADLELGWRLGHMGYENFVSENVVMRHRQGTGSSLLFSPFSLRKLTVLHFEPIRYYYQVRECVKLVRSFEVDFIWKKYLLREVFSRLVGVLLHGGRKVDSVRMWFCGLLDGVRGADREMRLIR